MGQTPEILWSHPQLAAAVARDDWGTVFRTYRKLTGLSQTKLGERVGLVQPDVSDIERGRRRVTSAEVQQRIIAGLGIPGTLQEAGAVAATGQTPVSGLALPSAMPDGDLMLRVAGAVDSSRRVDAATLDWLDRLDRVLCGEAEEAFVAAEGGGESEEGQVVTGMALVAVVESAVAGQPRDGALDDPPAAAQAFAGLDAFAGDAHADAFAA